MPSLGGAEILLIAEACRKESYSRQILADMAREIRKEAGPTSRTEVRSAAIAKFPKSAGLRRWLQKLRES